MANSRAYVVFIAVVVLGSHFKGDANPVSKDAEKGNQSLQRRILETFLGRRLPGGDLQCICCDLCTPEMSHQCICCQLCPGGGR